MWGSVDQSTWAWPTDPRSYVLSRRSYHQWWLVVDGSNPHRRWPGVNHGIIRYSFIDLGRMESWVDLAAQGYNEICWHDHHGNSNRGHSHGSKMVNPLCVFALKSSYCKTFRKTVENPRKDCNFLLLSGFFFRTLLWICFCDGFLPAKSKSRKEESFRKK